MTVISKRRANVFLKVTKIVNFSVTRSLFKNWKNRKNLSNCTTANFDNLSIQGSRVVSGLYIVAYASKSALKTCSTFTHEKEKNIKNSCARPCCGRQEKRDKDLQIQLGNSLVPIRPWRAVERDVISCAERKDALSCSVPSHRQAARLVR